MGSNIKHTLETVRDLLEKRNLNAIIDIKTIDINSRTIILIDKDFGEYRADMKSLCPLGAVPMHRLRKHKVRLDKFRLEWIGKSINGLEVLDVFFGPDRGYKNKSFYMEYRGACGHTCIDSKAVILKHKKTFKCQRCSAPIIHGERTRIDGKLKKRTGTYTHWQRFKNTLPSKYQDFIVFKQEIGEKPCKKATLVPLDGKFVWKELDISTDSEVDLMAKALRQAFRRSIFYKKAVSDSRVETDEGPRYACAACLKLSKRSSIQVDHIDPINPVDGSPLRRDDLIKRIWTDKIQILDRSCHTKKSALENAIRRSNKKVAKLAA